MYCSVLWLYNKNLSSAIFAVSVSEFFLLILLSCNSFAFLSHAEILLFCSTLFLLHLVRSLVFVLIDWGSSGRAEVICKVLLRVVDSPKDEKAKKCLS